MAITKFTPHSSSTKPQQWADCTNVAVGAFLVASPWLGLGSGITVMLNAVTAGIIIASAAGSSLEQSSAGAQLINICVGLWLLIAPWAVGFTADNGAMWTSVLVGVGVTLLASVQLTLLNRCRLS